MQRCFGPGGGLGWPWQLEDGRRVALVPTGDEVSAGAQTQEGEHVICCLSFCLRTRAEDKASTERFWKASHPHSGAEAPKAWAAGPPPAGEDSRLELSLLPCPGCSTVPEVANRGLRLVPLLIQIFGLKG